MRTPAVSRPGAGGPGTIPTRPIGAEFRVLRWLCRHPLIALTPAVIALFVYRFGPAHGRRHDRFTAGVAGGVVARPPTLLRPVGRTSSAYLLAPLDRLPGWTLGSPARRV